MISELIFENFKSLKNVRIPLGKITVLAGRNSSGKSTVVQGILLTRSLRDRILNSSLTEPQIHNFSLNGSYMLSLGSAFEAISKETGKEFKIGFVEQDKEIINRYYTEESDSDSVYEVSVDYAEFFDWCQFRDNPLYYLNAERFGPRIRHWVNEFGGQLHCGYRGEFTAEVLARTKGEKAEMYKPDEAKSFKGEKLDGFPSIYRHARIWMEYITPGSNLGDSEVHGKMRSTSIVMGDSTPPNVGFGISYVLPIVVTGLLAPAGSIMIVENPEAHLHPKGQSNIGFFLAQMAACGVQVIIETHSEHVINGIRRASLSGITNFNPSDVRISFFNGIDQQGQAKIDKIVLNDRGDLSDFPRDFFDQINQDMAEILKLRKPLNG